MPKIIVTSRYMKNSPKRTAAKLVKYMGTREGVERLPKGYDRSPATVRQERLIQDILKYDSSATEYPEYEDYTNEPCKSSASEFIDAFIERNADQVGEMDKFVNYMAQRPGVEKLGSHGLFSQSDDKIDIDKVAEEVGQHEGVIWTHVISLHREDAERLGYNSADAWKNLVRRNMTKIAEAHNISLSNLQWYAAFHNTTYHPHIHLMVYSRDPGQGRLKEKGIDTLRRSFGNDIFRNEQYKLFTMETQLRNELKESAKMKLHELSQKASDSFETSPQMTALFQKLMTQIKDYKGRKMYGYLPTEIKKTVNDIVSEIAKDDIVSELYAEWNRINREKLSLYYDKQKPEIPLEENKEFRSLKNYIIREAYLASDIDDVPVLTTINFSVSSLVQQLCRLIDESADRKMSRLHRQVDSKLMSKIEQKKEVHGLKTDRSITENEETESTKMRM